MSELSAGPIAARASTLRVGSESTMRRIVARGSIHIEKKGDIESVTPFAMVGRPHSAREFNRIAVRGVAELRNASIR